MSRVPVQRLLWALLAAASFAAVLLALVPEGGVGAGTEEPPNGHVVQQEAGLSPAEVTLSLVDSFPDAEARHAGAHVAFDNASDAEFLSSGWNPLGKGGPAWAMSRDAVVDVPIAHPQDLTLALTLGIHPAAPDAEVLPNVQSVKILWNGRVMGTYKVRNASQHIAFPVPAAQQRHGLNRMEILPFFWFVPRSAGVGDDRRRFAFQCTAMELVSDRVEYGGSPVAATVKKESIVQAPGSVLSYYFLLPEHAVLHAEGRLHAEGAELPEEVAGRVTLTLVDEKMDERVLLERDLRELAHSPDFYVHEDLTDLAGQAVALNLCFSLLVPALVPASQNVVDFYKRPDRDLPFRIGLSSPHIDGDLLRLEAGEALLFRGWIAGDKKHTVTVSLNGEPHATQPEHRADVAGRFDGLSSIEGFRVSIPFAMLQAHNDLAISVDERVQIGLRFDRPLTHDARPKALKALPWHELYRLEWHDPRIEGVQARLPAAVPTVPRERYNVIIVLSDALRADHLEPYGSTEVQTPELASLAQRSATFVHASANSGWTRPSIASLLTSQYVPAHGCATTDDALPDTSPYLPEILHNAGYRTMTVLSNPNTSTEFGFGRGFDTVHEHFRVRREVHDECTTPEAKAAHFWDKYFEPFLQEAQDQPFFVFYHELDPHDPYNPHPPYDTMYDPPRGHLDLTGEVGRATRSGAFPLTEGDVRYLQSQYKGEITFLDAHLKLMYERLAEKGLADRTLLVFLADHGDEFWEHLGIGHGHSLYEELLHVPLVFSLPGLIPAGKRPRGHVQLIDVPPTILGLIGEEIPHEMQGRSLLPYLFGPEDCDPPRATFARMTNGRTPGSDSIRVGHWKLIEETYAAGGHNRELYNLEKDPGEHIDRWPQELVVGKALSQMLRSYRRRNAQFQSGAPRKVETRKLSAEVVADLQALGYLE